ncbi:MAG: glycosyltransferase family 9 protein [Steroidobacteraceae bacterium]
MAPNSLNFQGRPPDSICLLRLSAIGDAVHIVPLIRTLQHAWPHARITWVIGRIEAKLMKLMPEIEFIEFDKRRPLAEFLRLRRLFAQRRFDLLLHVHLSFRASLISLLIRAPVKLGFDRARAIELQWLFTNQRIAPRQREHVLDSYWGFSEALGIKERRLEWNLPLPEDARAYAQRLIPDLRPTLLISPCASHSRRNWRAEYYALVADHAVQRWGMRVVLCGGGSALERSIGAEIMAHARQPLQNQIGLDTLPEMLALLGKAAVLISPDSGPAHMATAVATPVIGLYAPTNPKRSGPYLSLDWCIDEHERAAQVFMQRSAAQLPWVLKIERPGVMDLIKPEAVIAKLDEFMRQRRRREEC